MSVINIDWAAVGKLDDWARNRYLKLINEIGEREFTREEAEEILSEHGLGLEKHRKALFCFKRCWFDQRQRR